MLERLFLSKISIKKRGVGLTNCLRGTGIPEEQESKEPTPKA
ncbi:hypothetical protein Belba_2546 [Belliella baltica DSM 15883]|uniref:Uncharacterized protein n=1 Tax=Belliella baltica (strain DSM 15883 / CIP 108006 / LMG 21964 / BA134) TaxID=866536 RepID=I3Z781_BELBD|nr:hypothetical protein Belba_2546 [Belliella baltica DSM 15883]